jgi:large subunit ribosomal protein L22
MVGFLRGLSAEEAVAQLSEGSRRASRPLRKLVESAMASAEHNFSLDKSALSITEVRVDGGPVFKRGRPRGFGRVGLIRRRTAHITVVLEGDKKLDASGVKEKVAARPVEAEKAAEPAPREEKSRRPERTSITSQKAPSLARRFFRRKSI